MTEEDLNRGADLISKIRNYEASLRQLRHALKFGFAISISARSNEGFIGIIPEEDSKDLINRFEQTLVNRIAEMKTELASL